MQYHTWTTFIKPVLRSGLAALPIRPTVIRTLSTFHHKILRAILKLSKYSPVTPLYFLLGEVPMEASLHLDVLSLFWNIWSNPQTKAYEVTKYLLKMSDNSSVTWSAHLRLLCMIYNLPDPLTLMNTPAWSKQRWKDHTKAAVISYHEGVLRQKAIGNIKLQFFNVQVTGLSGKLHPALSWVLTTRDVMIIRPHIKMLSGDYMCYEYLAHDRGVSPHCRMCQHTTHLQAPTENMVHLLTRCRATADTRVRLMPDILNLVSDLIPNNRLLTSPTHDQLTQFLLDCSSLNLASDIRVPHTHPGHKLIARQCSTTIYAIHMDRTRQMKKLNLLK